MLETFAIVCAAQVRRDRPVLVRLVALVLLVMLAAGVARADVGPPPVSPAAVPAAPSRERRAEVFKEWWLWTLVAVLSAGTIVTSAVVAAMPGRALKDGVPGAGSQPMALTVRF
jgi:hypothetical protein